MAKKETPIVTVKATGNDSKVVLWERDEAHPDGEIFLANDGRERKVALTKAVKLRIQEGRLEEVETSKASVKKDEGKGKAKDDDKGNGTPPPNSPPAT